MSLVENMGSYSRGTVASIGVKWEDLLSCRLFGTGSSINNSSLFQGEVATFAILTSSGGTGDTYLEEWLLKEFF